MKTYNPGLFGIINNGNAEELKQVLDAGAEPNICNNVGETPLHKAAHHTGMVPLLLAAGANPNIKDDYDQTPLREAVLAGDAEAVKALLGYGASVDEVDNTGQTPLLLATRHKGNAEIVKALAEAGADVNAVDNTGETPIYNAVCVGDVDAFRILLEAGADPDKTCSNNKSARYIIKDNRSSAEMRTMELYLPKK